MDFIVIENCSHLIPSCLSFYFDLCTLFVVWFLLNNAYVPGFPAFFACLLACVRVRRSVLALITAPCSLVFFYMYRCVVGFSYCFAFFLCALLVVGRERTRSLLEGRAFVIGPYLVALFTESHILSLSCLSRLWIGRF